MSEITPKCKYCNTDPHTYWCPTTDPTRVKHWTTVVVEFDHLSVECSCSWTQKIENGRGASEKISRAHEIARAHRESPPEESVEGS